MNRVADILKVKYPIIQAPMTWLTSAELAAAVANAGGMGSLEPNAGQTMPAKAAEEATEQLRAEILRSVKFMEPPVNINDICHIIELNRSICKLKE